MFDEPAKELEAFSLVKRAKSFRYALRGIMVLLRTQHNMWLHLAATLCVVVFGAYFQISSIEWMFLILAIGFVLMTEAINTAIEFDIDLTSPELHPFARDTKDVAAAAVLLSVFVALIVGGIIFIPRILTLF